jgi:hypothetical protein
MDDRPPRIGDIVRVVDFRGRTRAFRARYSDRVGRIVAFSAGGAIRAKFDGLKTVQYWPSGTLAVEGPAPSDGGQNPAATGARD